ncbi:MAG: hypothetical protein AAFW00_18955 [Bacteroidota bacterium]
MKFKDLNIEVARLQKEISRRLDLSLDKLIFDYGEENQEIILNLITLNPKHEQSFLYHTAKGKDKVEVLEHMLEYVERTHRKVNTYTVQWTKRGEADLHTSYFRAKNMYDVLDKFFHGREKDAYVIFSLTMNPVA